MVFTEFTALKVPVPEEEVQFTSTVFITLPDKLTEAPSQIGEYVPASTIWFGVKFNIIKSETETKQGATACAVTANIIGNPALNSAALGV